MTSHVGQNEKSLEKIQCTKKMGGQALLLTRKGSIRVSIVQMPHEAHTTVIASPSVGNQQSTKNSSLPAKQNISPVSNGKVSRPKSCKCRKKPKKLEVDFQKKGVIGNGGFGKVFLVVKRDSERKKSDTYAMKVIPKEKLQQSASIQSLIIEKTILTEVQSQFIVGLKCAFQDSKKCFMVMDYAEGGDLYSYLHNKQLPDKVEKYKSLKQEAPRFILACVCRAIETLHTRNIVYRDLKPENILIFSDGYVKLTDFGLAAYQPENDYLTDMAGTRIYMAPEIIQDKKYTKEVDLWAMGILLYEMILLDTPYTVLQTAATFFRKRCNADQRDRKWKPGNISQEAKDLINSFLRVKPQERIGAKSFNDIKSHAFFNGFDWQALENKSMVSPLLEMMHKSNVEENTRDSASESHTQQHSEMNEQEYEEIPNLNYNENGQSPEKRLLRKKSCFCEEQTHEAHQTL